MKPYQSVLDKINNVRLEFGAKILDDLPKGQDREAATCPLAKAFEDIPGLDYQVEVSPDNIEFANATPYMLEKIAEIIEGELPIFKDIEEKDCQSFVYSPPDFVRFVRDFDMGKYPELILEEEG